MHFMNPQRGAHLGLTQLPSAAPATDDQAGAGDQDDNGIGSAASGYAGPEDGPFKCGNCVHYDGQGNCDNPTVQADPEVNGEVDPEGCCNLFRPGEEGGGEEENEPGEEGAIPGAGEQP